MGMTLQLQSTADSDTAFGSIGTGPISFVGNIAPIVQAVNLASGANTITPPANAIGVVICPPTTNVVALTLKGVTGDTGVSIPASSPSVHLFGTLPATFVVTAGSATTGYTQFLFW